MKTIKDDIASFLKEQKILIPRLSSMDRSLIKLEKGIKRHITSAWKKATKRKVDLDVMSMQSGSHCTSFKMDASISIPGYVIIGRKWLKASYDDDINPHFTAVESPVDIKFLKEFAEKMAEELGISVYEYQERLPTEEQKKEHVEKHGFVDFNGANAYFDNDLELIKSGEVWYKGWDISDPFLVCRRKSNSALVVAYSSNGHGFGFDHILDGLTDDELEKFLIHIEQDSDHAGVRTFIRRGER